MVCVQRKKSSGSLGEWHRRESWYLSRDTKKLSCKGFTEHLMIEFSYYIKWHYIVGFLVSTTSVIGHEVNGSYVRFAQRHQHHDSKQPILVVYTDDGMSRHPNYISPNDEGKNLHSLPTQFQEKHLFFEFALGLVR